MPLAELLSPDVIPTLTSRRTYEAGQEYFEAGRVLRLDAGTEHAKAKVDGTDDAPFTSRMRLTPSGELSFSCTCPPAQEEGTFCKHLVATSLAWNRWNSTPAFEMKQPRGPAVELPVPGGPQVIRTVDDVDRAVDTLFAVQMGREPEAAPALHSLPGAENREPLRWVRPGEAVTIGPVTLTSGLVYVGSRPRGFRQVVPRALLDPRYRVASFGQSHHWLGAAYPDYISLTEAGRRAFLGWLAEGRNDPWVHLNYVQLFFSGLEYRVLVDGHLPEFEAERSVIDAELERLLNVYGARMPEALRRAMRNLRDWLALSTDLEQVAESVNIIERPGHAGVQQVRIAMALAERRREKLDTRLAFEWALTDAKPLVRGYVLQYPKALYRCFESLVQEHMPEGISVQSTGQSLQVGYSPMSGDLASFVESPKQLSGLRLAQPSVSQQAQLYQLLTASAEELESYSQFCIRNPGCSESLEATLLLPARAMPAAQRKHAESLVDETGFTVHRLWDVLLGFDPQAPRTDAEPSAPTHVPQRMVESLASTLENFGVGMEPCHSRMPRQVSTDVPVCLFLRSEGIDNEQTRLLYDCMCAALRLVFTVLQATPANAGLSRGFLASWLEQAPMVPGSLRRRLRARAELEVPGPWSTTGVRKALGDLPDTLEPWLLQGLLGAAQLHPSQAAQAVKALQKAYKVIDRDPATVFGDLHSHAARRGAAPAAYEQGQSSGKFALNSERLARLQVETESTDQLLAAIFTEESEAPIAATPASPTIVVDAEAEPQQAKAAETAQAAMASRRLWSLDVVHSELAFAILERTSWSRDELKALAKQKGRMLDGALERINDAAFDIAGVPLCEGDDPVDVNSEIFEHIPA